MNLFKSLLKNIVENPKTTVAGIAGVVGLFTPVSPIIVAAATSAALIAGACDPKKESK